LSQKYRTARTISDATKPRISLSLRHSESPGRPEIEHFGNCPFCGTLVDMRDLAQVFAHMHDQQPLDLTSRPDPDEQ
jgi:hypothetical protein